MTPPSSPPPTGLLIVRVWREEEGDGGLRIRLTGTDDLARPEVDIGVATTVRDALQHAERWLTAFEHRSGQ